MKRLHLVWGLLLLVCQYSYASEPVNLDTKNPVQIIDDTPQQKWDKAIGTFQFEILKGRNLTEINIGIIDQIEENRHDTEVTYLQYNDRMRIKILPRSTINSDFEKLELRVFVESFASNN